MFNNVEPRTREERLALKDRDRIEQMRLRDRIGSYHKYVDNVLVNNPDPVSSHFLPDNDRFNKDFAAYDKIVREEAHKKKLEIIEQKRIEKYERDLKRWEFMDEEGKRQAQKIEQMNDKYLTGQRNKGGAAYNILSLQYDNSQDGEYLKQRDEDQKVRALMRSKNIDTRSNCGYNLVNGNSRSSVDVPQHKVYNPDSLQSVGATILGTGYAGKPIRKDIFEGSRSNHTASAQMGYDQGYQQQQQSQIQQQQQQQMQMNPVNVVGQYIGLQKGQSSYQSQSNLKEQAFGNQQYNPNTFQGGSGGAINNGQFEQQAPAFQGFNQPPPPNPQQNYSQQQQQPVQIGNAGGGLNNILPINQQQQQLYGGQGHYLYNQPNTSKDQMIAPIYGQQQQAAFNQQFNSGGAGTKFF